MKPRTRRAGRPGTRCWGKRPDGKQQVVRIPFHPGDRVQVGIRHGCPHEGGTDCICWRDDVVERCFLLLNGKPGKPTWMITLKETGRTVAFTDLRGTDEWRKR